VYDLLEGLPFSRCLRDLACKIANLAKLVQLFISRKILPFSGRKFM